MEICTFTRTRATTLPSRALGAVASTWQGRGPVDVPVAKPSVVALQGGAIAVKRMAPVSAFMVTDHPYTTRLGSPSCSPPV